MSDELKLHQQMAAGARAQAALEDPIIGEAFDKLEAAYFDAWKRSQPSDTAKREQLHIACTIIGKIREDLRKTIADGRAAQVIIATATPGPDTG